jgi:fucokinase
MATGGGWQDQVGAIFPGFKIGRSLPSLPLTVTVEAIATSAEFNACFQSRCFLLFTGKQRLAKTTLINALRNTALVPQEIPGSYEEYDKNNTISSLVHGAESLYTALTTELQQDINAVVTKVARHLSDYWRFKQDMGGADTEPVHCTRLFEFLNHYLAGYSLCGAGGGGFACIIVKEGVDEQVIRDSINGFNSKQETDYQFTVHRVQLDQTGLVAETRELEEGGNLLDFL